MEFIPEEISDYASNHSTDESELLKKLSRNTHAQVLMPRMLSGHLQGRFLSMLSKLQRPETILEIGTYTGYSALCLAEGLSDNGKLISIDISDEHLHFAKKHIEHSELNSKIELITGNALDIIPTLNHKFDLVFIDADKKNYSAYFDLVFDKISSGGLIIADNVLWSGKVLMPPEKMDADTKAIHAFNEKIKADMRIEKVLLPVRDGLLLMRKK